MHPSIRKLLKKYRDDEISAEEMRDLRESVDSVADHELGELLSEDWDDFNSRFEHQRRQWMPALFRVAAAAAVLFLGGTCWYLYRQLNAASSAEAVVAATPYQTSLVTLPDGSTLTMRQDSRMAYNPAGFARGERRLTFEGEGYFDIHSDAAHPFVISAPGFEAIVKGTSFNLYGSPADSVAELALISGSVEIKTAKGGLTRMTPNQKAIINRLSGKVAIRPCGTKEEVASWQCDEIILDNATPAEIARAFQRYYGVSVTIDCDSTETFTGTLPISSMPLAMKVVQLALGSDVTAHP